MRIAATGHRPSKLGNDYTYTSPLSIKIMMGMTDILMPLKAKSLADDIELKIISGMALGVDTMWAMVGMSLLIPVIAAIPDMAQADRWPPTSQSKYYRILDKCHEVVNVSKSSVFKMEHLQQRNIWMVDNCDLLVAVYNGDQSGGTYNCIQYAKQKIGESRIITINPKEIVAIT